MGNLRGIAGAALALSVLLVERAGAQDKTLVLPEIGVTSSRLGGGIVGASTSVITSEQIARSPSESLQDLIGREAGIQTTSLFGGVNGAGTTIDMRGFGASAVSNTLVLINGRRLNDIDMANVNFAAIPRNSIDHIEITRGNSGAVLYGDNAVGGVINIVTKSAVGQPASGKVEGSTGSFRHAEGTASASGSVRPLVDFRLRHHVYFRRLSRKQRHAAKQRRRRLPLHGAGRQRLPQHYGRRPASRPAGRPARRRGHRPQSNWLPTAVVPPRRSIMPTRKAPA